jgi:Fe-S cluster assembly protein SufD
MSLARAIEASDPALLPGRRDEELRWTDIRGLIRAVPPISPDAEVLGEGPFAGEAVIIVNGHPAAQTLAVAAGETRTLALRFVSRAEGTAHHAAVRIDVAAGGSLVLLESYEGQGAAYVADATLDLRLADGARVERVVIASDEASAVSVSTAEVSLGAGASFAQTVLTDGARRQRLETRVRHPGQGASVRLDGVYLVGAGRHADLTSIVTHAGAEGVTSELVKGAAAGQGRAVFQGRIVVERGADQTDARMGHHALILSDRAEVDAKPELLIFADDVSCAHGNTVGALDEDALFYARQRGIAEAEAKAMLTEAFVGEVVDRVEDEAAREVARAWVAEKLKALA